MLKMAAEVHTKRASTVLIVSLLTLYTSFSSVSCQCQHGKTAAEAGKTFPSLGTKSFKADLYGWMLFSNSTMHTQEHWSKESGKGSVYYVSPGRQTFYITTEEGDGWFGENGECFKKNPGNKVSEMIHLVRSSLDPNQVTYIEDTELAGIPAERWRACLSFSPILANAKSQVAVDVYLTRDQDWTMYSADQDKTPLRLEVRIYNGNEVFDHYFYDFTSFENMEYDPDKFQQDLEPPLGAMCPGMDEGKVQPELPKSARLTRESISNYWGSELVESSEVILDQARQILQRKSDSATLVRDFSGGASYAMFWNKKQSNSACTITPINTYNDNSSINVDFTERDHYVSLDSVKDFLFLSGDATYNGERTSRGIPCDVYTHVIDKYGFDDKPATVLLYFSKAGVKMLSSEGPTDKGRLVRVEVINESRGKVFNIYSLDHYDFYSSREMPYDVSSCFPRDQRIEAVLLFDVEKRETLTSRDLRGLERSARHEVSKMADLNLDIVRVHVGKAIQLGDKLGLTVKVFARPLSGIFYDQHDKKSFGDGAAAKDSIKKVISDVDSITRCGDLAEDDPTVTDADICYDSKECTLYGSSDSGQDIKLVPDSNCAHLTKIRGYHSRTTLEEAWELLKTSVESGDFSVQLKDRPLRATTVKLTHDPKKQTFTPLRKFTKNKNILMTTTSDEKKLTLNLHDCAEACLHEPTFPCESFSHCEATSQCELHGSYMVYARPSTRASYMPLPYVTHNGCDTYVRSYIHNFEHLPGLARFVVVSTSDKEYGNVASEDMCAKLCMERDDVQCESFDYCLGDGEADKCVLRRYHARDNTFRADEIADGGRLEANCSHYSRNYFWDYLVQDGVTTLPVSYTVRFVASQESCAHECSSNPDCEVFHFCDEGGKTQCQFLDTSSGKPKPSDMRSNPYCSTFTRKANADVLRRTAHVRERTSKMVGVAKSEGYSGGAMGGLAIAMILVGVAFCFLGLYGFAVYQRQMKTVDDMKGALSMDEVVESAN